MKVAILLSGQAKCVDDHYENFKTKILDKFSHHDIYIATPRIIGTNLYSSDGTEHAEESLDKLQKLYQPRIMMAEKYDIEAIKAFLSLEINKYKVRHEDTNVTNTLGMFHGWYQLSKLFAPSVYDFAIKFRFDTSIIEGDIEYTDGLSIPLGANFRGGIGDVMCYGNPELVQKYLSLWDSLDKCYDTIGHVHPESFLRYHLNNIHNICPKRTKVKLKVRNKIYNDISADEYIDKEPYFYTVS